MVYGKSRSLTEWDKRGIDIHIGIPSVGFNRSASQGRAICIGTPDRKTCKGDFPFLYEYKMQRLIFCMTKERTELESFETIEFYCRKCRKSLKISYVVTGEMQAPVLPNVQIKCHHCTRVMIMKNYTEEQLTEHSKDGRQYI